MTRSYFKKRAQTRQWLEDFQILKDELPDEQFTKLAAGILQEMTVVATKIVVVTMRKRYGRSIHFRGITMISVCRDTVRMRQIDQLVYWFGVSQTKKKDRERRYKLWVQTYMKMYEFMAETYGAPHGPTALLFCVNKEWLEPNHKLHSFLLAKIRAAELLLKKSLGQTPDSESLPPAECTSEYIFSLEQNPQWQNWNQNQNLAE